MSVLDDDQGLAAQEKELTELWLSSAGDQHLVSSIQRLWPCATAPDITEPPIGSGRATEQAMERLYAQMTQSQTIIDRMEALTKRRELELDEVDVCRTGLAILKSRSVEQGRGVLSSIRDKEAVKALRVEIGRRQDFAIWLHGRFNDAAMQGDLLCADRSLALARYLCTLVYAETLSHTAVEEARQAIENARTAIEEAEALLDTDPDRCETLLAEIEPIESSRGIPSCRLDGRWTQRRNTTHETV